MKMDLQNQLTATAQIARLPAPDQLRTGARLHRSGQLVVGIDRKVVGLRLVAAVVAPSELRGATGEIGQAGMPGSHLHFR